MDGYYRSDNYQDLSTCNAFFSSRSVNRYSFFLNFFNTVVKLLCGWTTEKNQEEILIRIHNLAHSGILPIPNLTKNKLLFYKFRHRTVLNYSNYRKTKKTKIRVFPLIY